MRNLFCSISSLEKKNEENNGCCSLNYKTGVQIMAGILTIFSAVFLVLHYVKLDQMIEDKFERMFKQEPTWNLRVCTLYKIKVHFFKRRVLRNRSCTKFPEN